MQLKIIHNFNSNFNSITKAFWQKQFVNYRDDLKSIDVLDRTIDRSLVPSTYQSTYPILNTTRLFISKPPISSSLPTWVKSLISIKTTGYTDDIYSIEHTSIDLKNKILSGTSSNINFKNLFEFKEDFKYEEILGKVSYEHNLCIKVHIPFIGRKLESIVIESVRESSRKGIKLITDLSEKRFID